MSIRLRRLLHCTLHLQPHPRHAARQTGRYSLRATWHCQPLPYFRPATTTRRMHPSETIGCHVWRFQRPGFDLVDTAGTTNPSRKNL